MDEFEEGVHYIDLKKHQNLKVTFCHLGILDEHSVRMSKNIFLLSQKAILAQTVAKIHGKSPKHVNQKIKRNLDEFEEGVHYIDLKKHQNLAVAFCDSGIISQKAVNASNNIFLLSQRGYVQLVFNFKGEKAKKIKDHVLDVYFRHTQSKGNNIQKRDYNIYDGMRMFVEH